MYEKKTRERSEVVSATITSTNKITHVYPICVTVSLHDRVVPSGICAHLIEYGACSETLNTTRGCLNDGTCNDQHVEK